MSDEAKLAVRRMAVDALLETRQQQGRIPMSAIRFWADQLDVSVRSMWRWVDAEGPAIQARDSYELSEEDRQAFYDHRGNISAAWRSRRLSGCSVSRATLARAYEREMTPAERAYARGGEAARNERTVYLRYEAEHRNHTCQADHKELPVLVVPPRGQKPRKPWMTVFIDDSTRAVKAIAVSLVPDQATVLAGLKQCVLPDASGCFGGVPDRLFWDNGLEFVADAVTEVGLALGTITMPAKAYSPHLKGKVERFNRTVVDEFISGLPFYTHGPSRSDGRLYGPDRPPMDFETFVSELLGWVEHYNHERPNSALDGRTPREAWEADPTPIRQFSEEELRWLAIPSHERKVLHDGIHHQSLAYIAPELGGLVGEKLLVKFMPHDRTKIDVFRNGEWLCTAYPQRVLGPDEREAVLRQREASRRQHANAMRRTSSRARRRLSAATAGSPAQDLTVIGREEARRDRGPVDQRDLRRAGRAAADEFGAAVDAPLEEDDE